MPTHATLSTGTIPTSQLATGTPDGTKFLRDDGVWAATAGGGVSDGDKGDVVVSGTGTVWTLDTAISAKLVTNGDTHDHSGGDGAQITYGTLSGTPTLGDAAAKNTGTGVGTVAAGDHTHTGVYQPVATVLTNTTAAFTTAQETKLSGIATGAQVNVATDLSYTAATRVLASSTGTDATLPLVSTADAGLAPASGGGTSNFLRADGTWAAPSGGPGGEAFPVGAVFIAVVSTNPGTLLGYGTWSAFGAGKVLIGLDSGDTDFDTVEETGGAKTVASSGTNAAEAAHTHTYTEVPNHVHVLNGFPTATGGSTGFTRDTSMSGTPADTGLSTKNPTGGVATGTTAGGSSHTHTYTGSATSVVQPYIVVYMWKRTA